MLKRRRGTVIVILGFIAITYILYTNVYLNREKGPEGTMLSKEMINHVINLKTQLAKSERTIKDMETKIGDLENQGVVVEVEADGIVDKGGDEEPHAGGGVNVQREPVKISKRGDVSQKSYDLAVISPDSAMCSLAEAPAVKTDIQMFNVVDSISFADKDGGVWKQGFDIKYSESEWTEDKPLKVFVIPHSHDDPGWLKTFDGYYSSQVQHILDNMVTKLGEHKHMKFIYAEISFFSKWWSTATNTQKEAVKQYISEGRFELVTGGWVMPDEAASHYWALIDQLIEGHAWIRENIGESMIPRSGWSIDPFGHTSTMAYILRQSGLKNMLVQRVHYSIKKYFAENKYLEFNWRQTWDKEGSTDILCHMMPFYSYDVPHTCGPDPKVCCQFDFVRLPGGRVSCPWRVPPQPITEANVHERSGTLLDQYRKKSQLYRSNVVLIPLGDDFRYDSAGEWDKQYHNYQKLFEHMNSQADWHVEAKFGTLSDYFREVRKEMSGSAEFKQSSLEGYPTLSGDFYTYADRADHYWSGYFTSRPFYKHWDRHLESTLRSAEIIFSIAQAQAAKTQQTAFPVGKLYSDLTYARQSLGLFQHHDGITGTAKTVVNNDYGQRMLEGWKNAYKVISQSAQLLLNKKHTSAEILDMDWIKDNQGSQEVKKKHHIAVGESKKFVIYNSSPEDREEIVRVWVTTVPASVYDSDNNAAICQISPHFTGSGVSISDDTYKLSFLAKVPALGLAVYRVESSEAAACTISTVEFINTGDDVTVPHPVFQSLVLSEPPKVEIHNDQITATIDPNTGMIQTVNDKKENRAHRLEMNFIMYKSDTGRDHAGGAYLFFPHGKHQLVSHDAPLIIVIKGNLVHEVQTITKIVGHHIRIYNTPGPDSLGVEITNRDLMTSLDNTDLAMQISTDIENKDITWYTDLNGFTMHKRKYQSKIQLQGNVYPMTSMAYIEDSSYRLNILAAQSAGVISPQLGDIQIILDRRMNQDDNRGLGEAIKDNKQTESKFFITVEKKLNSEANIKPIGYPSLASSVIYRHFISPLIPLPFNRVGQELKTSVYKPLTKAWPCELHLLNLRALKAEEEGLSYSNSLLLVHHQSTDCGVESRGVTCQANSNGKLDITDLFRDLSLKSFERRTLTNLEELDDSNTKRSSTIEIDPMTINAYKLTLN